MSTPSSPFVSIQSPDAYKIHTFQNGGLLSMSIDKLSNAMATVDTITDVEDFYFADKDMPGELVELSVDNPVSETHGAQVNAVVLSLAIMRAANKIATLQRRGSGNVALMHPDTAKQLGVNSPLPLAQIAAPTEAQTIGRWTLAGKLNYSLTLWTSEAVPANKVYVVYVGAQPYDQPTCRINGSQYDVYPKASSSDQHFYSLDLVTDGAA